MKFDKCVLQLKVFEGKSLESQTHLKSKCYFTATEKVFIITLKIKRQYNTQDNLLNI